MSEKKLVLIDGYNFLFRAYYAIKSLSRSDGLPTGALFGFTRMLMNVLVDIQCSHIAVIFDTGQKNFRHTLFPEYKTNRPPAPDDLIPQFPLARTATEALNIDIIEKVGYEADDIIATLARKAAKENFEVLIISSDKDLWQLVTDKIFIYDAIKKQKIGSIEVKEKWGVYPKELLDVLTLMGDTSDNIPGVNGIGPKTAALLVNTYGNVEDILANVDKIKQEKRRETIKASSETIKLSKKLITLDEDVKLNIKLDDLTVKHLNPVTFIKFLKQMEFYSIAKKIEEAFKIKVENTNDLDLFHEETKNKETIISKLVGTLNNNVLPQIIPDNDKQSQKFEFLKELSDLQSFMKKIEDQGKLFLNIQTEYIKFDSKILSVTLSTGKNSLFIKIKNQNKSENTLDLFAKKDEKNKQEIQFVFQDIAKELKNILEKKDILKIGFDIKKQIKILNEFDIKIFPIEDICVMSYILDAGLYVQKLSAIIAANLKDKNEKRNKFIEALTNYEKEKNIQNLIEKETDFAEFQIDAIIALYTNFKQRISDEKMNSIYENFERPMTQVLAEIELNGMKADVVELNKLSDDFTKKIAVLEKEIYKLAGKEFNIGSPKQLSEILFIKLKLAPKKKSSKTGNFSTNLSVLEDLDLQDIEIAKKVLEWRHYSKLKTTYTDTLPKQINKKTGRIHTTFSNTTAVTGRLSSNDPNLQNIPIRSEAGNKIRKAFVASRGYRLISADYSQVELRVLANYLKVKELIRSFKANEDIHTATAAKVFEVDKNNVTDEMRRIAKAINFSIVYGTSAYGLAKRIKKSHSEAQTYIDNYFKLYPEVKVYMEESKEFAKKNGFAQSFFGRKCHINMKAKGTQRGFAERLSINAPIQGTAADIIKKAMINLDYELKKINSKAKIVLQVHDELILETPNNEAESIAKLLKETMENVFNLDVSLAVEVKIGDNWAEIH
jgi:DNA polymerase I